ncbi:putative sporulation transcription regulator WhiA [Clostridium sp. CAG:710]|mgnify:FL=1|nr:putative sporulation transcription regulator WhiA [Clostridium sp. CAG:710]
MSFTSEIKNETSMLNLTQSEKIAELSAFIRSNGKIFDDYIELYTENIKIAKRMFSFIKDLYNVNCEIENRSNQLFTKKNIYYVYIKEKKQMILEDLSIIDQDGNYLETVSEYIVGSLDEIKAYIRGSFYARGSINDPKTSQYHLEFLYDNKFEAVFIQRLLNEFELNAKILMREKKYMVYIKDSDDISDFLKLIGASQGVMYYENIRALKEQKNITNRLNNCEQANTDKILMSSNEQIKDINLIVEKLGEEFLDEKLLEAANYRCKYPESSLLELSEIMSMETGKNITKSGLNHRFRKIKEIASRLRSNDK